MMRILVPRCSWPPPPPPRTPTSAPTAGRWRRTAPAAGASSSQRERRCAPATAQDTYKCADGWALEEDRSGCRCFLFAEGEAVMKDTADLLCKAHEGWVAELDHPGINYWLKSKLLEITDIGRWEAFW